MEPLFLYSCAPRRRLLTEESVLAQADPVLEEVVAKLKYLGPGRVSVVRDTSATPAVLERPVAGCVCGRPLRLVMCALCGETFPARLRVECAIHPRLSSTSTSIDVHHPPPDPSLCRAVYLQDVSACKGCQQTDLSQLLEYDLPAGMEQGVKKIAKI